MLKNCSNNKVDGPTQISPQLTGEQLGFYVQPRHIQLTKNILKVPLLQRECWKLAAVVAVRGDGGLRDHDHDDGEQWAGVQAAGRGPLPLPAASCEPRCPAPSCPAPAAAAADPQPGDEYKTAGMSQLTS